MRILLLSILGLITGCSTAPKSPRQYHAPSVSGVASPLQRTSAEMKRASDSFDRLIPHINESGKAHLATAKEAMAAALAASEEARQGLVAYATQVDAQTKDLNLAVLERDKAVAKEKIWKVKAHDAARERDVILIFFAIVAAFWIGTMFAGEILRNFPAPWSFVAAGGLYLGTGIAAYTAGRIFLHAVSKLIP